MNERLKTHSKTQKKSADLVSNKLRIGVFQRYQMKCKSVSKKSPRYTLLFLDGDNFKYINDTWGHATGDRVLIEIAKRLAEFGGLRHKAYRLGGDEFAMVLYDVQSESEVQQICSALTQIFNLPFDLHNGHQTTMTLSIGYAMTIEHASAEKLQELADHNMYQAKHQRAEKLVR